MKLKTIFIGAAYESVLAKCTKCNNTECNKAACVLHKPGGDLNAAVRQPRVRKACSFNSGCE